MDKYPGYVVEEVYHLDPEKKITVKVHKTRQEVSVSVAWFSPISVEKWDSGSWVNTEERAVKKALESLEKAVQKQLDDEKAVLDKQASKVNRLVQDLETVKNISRGEC